MSTVHNIIDISALTLLQLQDFLTPEEGHAYVIFRVDNNEKACEHLKENGVDVIEENSLL